MGVKEPACSDQAGPELSSTTGPTSLELSAEVGLAVETDIIKEAAPQDVTVGISPPRQQQQQQQTDATGTMLGEMPTQARQDMHVDSSHEPQQKGMPSIAAVAHAQAFAKALNEARKKKKTSPSQLA